MVSCQFIIEESLFPFIEEKTEAQRGKLFPKVAQFMGSEVGFEPSTLILGSMSGTVMLRGYLHSLCVVWGGYPGKQGAGTSE